MKNKNSDAKFWTLILGISLGIVALAFVLLLIFGGGFEGIFAELGELQPVLLIVALAVIVAAFLILFRLPNASSAKSNWTVKELVVGALCIALSFVLSYLKLFEMPYGGSITPASMLPVMIYSYIYGVNRGLIAGIALGLLNLLQDAYVLHWAQLLVDYVFAFAAIGLAGAFKNKFYFGILLAVFGRFFFAALSGAIFFAEYAPVGQNPFVYSAIYNGSYLLPEAAICLGVALIPVVRHAIVALRKEHRIPSPAAQVTEN